MKVELEIKPQSLDDGLVLYSGQNEDGSGDYVVILMKDGYLEFRYNAGSGSTVLFYFHSLELYLKINFLLMKNVS
jgi:dystroglycan 1